MSAPPIRKRSHVSALALTAALLLSSACADTEAADEPGSTPEAERYGGTAVLAVGADVRTFDPLGFQDGLAIHVNKYQLFTPLVRYDTLFRARPLLAERWDTVRVGADSIDLTFHLRSDVRWHDGVPTTAGDVRFAFERMMDPATAFPAVFFLRGYSPRVAVLDDSTVRFRLRPFPEFLEIWSLVGGLPEHLLGEIPPEEWQRGGYGRNPVGNGPFRFVSRSPGQSWRLEANDDHPEALGGRPYLDRIVYRNIPDATARLTEIATGAVDVDVDFGTARATQAQETPGVRVVPFQTPTWTFVAWNTRHPRFADARVRRALTHAIDRAAIVRGLLHGYAVEGRTTVTPLHWSFDDRDPSTTLAYDPDLAARLLDDAGWRRRGGDGVRTDASGAPFSVEMLCDNMAASCDLAQAVQAHLGEVGVEVRIRRLEFSTLNDRMANPAPDGNGRDFEAVIGSYLDPIGKTDEHLLGSAAHENAYAATGYSSPVLDSLFEAIDRTADRDAARPLWRRYQQEVARAAPYTVLFYPRSLAAVGERIQGVEAGVELLAASPRWWIPPGRRR